MKKKLISVMMILAMFLTAFMLTAAKASSVYSDITGQWFTDAAEKYGYSEVFKDGSGKFNPSRKITRIEFVRLLHKALGISINYFTEPDVSKDFTDMKNTDVGAGALIDLVTTGIIDSGGCFNPGKTLERDLMVHWIMKALDYETGGNYSVPKRLVLPFDDDKDITEAYKSKMYTAQLLSFIFGRGNNTFFPRDGAIRAEAVTIVMRLMTFLESMEPHVAVTPFAWIAEDGSLTMSLTILNGSDKPVTVHHTSGMKFDFKLIDAAGSNVYTWSADKLFIAALTSTEIKPGESIVFSDTLDAASYPAVSTAQTMTAYIVGTSDDFTIDENGYTAAIVK